LGCGPGTNLLPVKFIASRFQVSICIGVTLIDCGESITYATEEAKPW
jgi:hypothetical protein